MTEHEIIVFGSLFQDFLKFWNRKFETGTITNSSRELPIFILKLLQDESIKFIINDQSNENILKGKEIDNKKILSSIIKEAKFLSGSTAAAKLDERRMPLLKSIFSSIGKNVNNKGIYYQPISSLTSEGYIFPFLGSSKGEDLKNDAFKYDIFENELNSINEHDIESILFLFKKYFWCVPFDESMNYSDVSIYESSRIKTAISICLYDFLKDKYQNLQDINTYSVIEDKNESRFLLICADFTGIQKYIYNIAHKGAIKALKGRSFYLQQMLDTISYWMIKQFDIPISNILYSSGGKFYILAPSMKTKMDILENIQKKLDEKLLEEYSGEIGIVIGFLELSGSDLIENNMNDFNISKNWSKVGEIVERNKYKKFSSSFNKRFFKPFGPSGSVITCYATGKDICSLEKVTQKLKEKDLFDISENENEKKYICKEQYEAQKIGASLRKSDIILTSDYKNGYSMLKIEDFIMTDFNESSKIKTRLGDSRALLLNDDNFLKLPESMKRGWKFYGGNWSIDKDFEELSKNATGIHQLGVLRMDVDNLGKIFQNEIIVPTFSRIIQLSTMLDFFFCSYLNKIKLLKWDEIKGLNDDKGIVLEDVIQIVYSGGDDIFIVGIWNILPDVALWIYDQFIEFTCCNPIFSLSAGITLFPGTFPIYKASKLAGIAEEKAKNFKRKISTHTAEVEIEKNAINFLDTSMSWNDFRKIKIIVNNLYFWIEHGRNNKKLSRSILSDLQLIYQEFRKGRFELWAKWRWRALYTLSRFAERNQAFRDEIEKIINDLFYDSKTEQEFIQLINVLARWAEFLTRKENS